MEIFYSVKIKNFFDNFLEASLKVKGSFDVRNGDVLFKIWWDFRVIKYMFDTINKIFRSTLVDDFLVNYFFGQNFYKIGNRKGKTSVLSLSFENSLTKT